MKDLVIFIENAGYLKYTRPYIKIIEDLEIDYQIFSLESSKQLGFEKNKVLYFDNKTELNKKLKSLSCKCFITTTPGIGNLYFNKSKVHPKSSRPKYVYFFHSLVSPNENYSKKSFSGFDLVFSPNEVISSQLKFLVNVKETEIVTVGYQHLNGNNYSSYETTNNILIAPSWGKNNLFSKIYENYLLNLVANLKDLNLEVFLRPHIMDQDNLTRLKDKQNFNFYTDEKINYSLFEYLITDWSGISLEFFYATNKTVAFIDTPKKIRRKLKNSELDIDLVENKVRNRLGPILDYRNPDLQSMINFEYMDSEYIDSLYNPKFNKDIVKEKLFKLLN